MGRRTRLVERHARLFLAAACHALVLARQLRPGDELLRHQRAQGHAERLVDFDRINNGPTRLSVGAVNVQTGNFVYFDSTKDRIRPEHVMASGALPPAFAAVELDGEYYWDGGLVSNTPLRWVVESRPQRDTLVFQVDLWPSRGDLPHNMACVSCIRAARARLRRAS